MSKKDCVIRVRLESSVGYLYVTEGKVKIEPGELYSDTLSKPFIFTQKTKNKKKQTFFMKHNSSSKYLAMPHLGHDVALSSEKSEMSLIDMKSPVWKFVGLKNRKNFAMVVSASRYLEVCDQKNRKDLLHFESVMAKEIQKRSRAPEISTKAPPGMERAGGVGGVGGGAVGTKKWTISRIKNNEGAGAAVLGSVIIGSTRHMMSREELPSHSPAHLPTHPLTLQADVFLVSPITQRYKQTWVALDINYVLYTKSNKEIIPLLDTSTCSFFAGPRQWVGTVGSHLYHFTLSSMVADFQFATPVEDVVDRLFSAIQMNKEHCQQQQEKQKAEAGEEKKGEEEEEEKKDGKGKEKEEKGGSSLKHKKKKGFVRLKESFWSKTGGGMDVWKRRAVAIDGCVVIELPPEIKSDGKWIGEIDPDILITKGVFINLMDVSSISVPVNCTDKEYQLRLTAKNGLFKFAFDTERHLGEWNAAIEEAKNQAISLRSNQNSQKTQPLWAGENPLAHRCREEEAQWGIHYNVHHHLLQCCVFGEIDMMQYLVKHRGADVEYVLPHMPEGNTFFDIGDTALKVGYRFDRPEVTTLVQQIIDHVEEEETKEEQTGDFSKSYGSAVAICTPKTHRNRSRSISSSVPTLMKEHTADYSHVMLTEKQKSFGFWEDREVRNLPIPEWVNMIPAVLFDENGLPNILVLRDHFFREGRLSLSCVHRIIRMAKKLFRREPNVINLNAPVNIFGDIHGQFYDLLTQLEKLEVPTNSDFEPCLFLGDYVDRGMFSCEVVLYMLALKIRYPKKIFLLRGNHETRNLTEFFNFRIECLRKYNREVYAMLMDLFDYLPLASVVTNKQGRFFCLHGGLSPSLQYIEEIDRIHRIEEVPETGPMCDLLWCDPYRADAYPDEAAQNSEGNDADEGFDGWDSDDSEEEVVVQQALKAPSATGEDIRFIGNHVRGSGYIFGGAAAEPFLMDNRLLMIVRAHEVMNEGYLEYFFGRNDRKHPQVVTIFSAPNYCDMYGNDAAVMRIKEDGYEYMISQSVEHPYYLPDLTNAIHYTFPFIMENLSELMYGAVMFFVAPREDDDEEEEKNADAKTLQRLDSLHSMKHLSRKARAKNERNMEEAMVTGAVGKMDDKFKNARTYDLANETNPLLVAGGRNSVRSISRLKGLMILDQLQQQYKNESDAKNAQVKTPSLASKDKRKDLASASSARDRSFTVSSSLLPLPVRTDPS